MALNYYNYLQLEDASLDVANVHVEVAHRSNLQEEEEAPGIIDT